MKVRVKLIDRKYRLIDNQTGRPILARGGDKVADGGGHRRQGDAMKQAKIINRYWKEKDRE